MELKINKQCSMKLIALFLCLFIAIAPFFQPKKVQANPMLLLYVTGLLVTGIIAGGYAKDVILTPEQQAATNEELTANLQAAFPDPAEYNNQLTTLQNLDNDIRAGKDIDWSKYSGKALYAVLKGVVDVVWPSNPPETLRDGEIIWRYTEGGYITWKLSANGYGPKNPILKLLSKTATEEIYTVGKVSDFVDKDVNISPSFLYYPYGSTSSTSSYDLYGYWVKDGYIKTAFESDRTIGSPNYELWMKLFFGQNTHVPDITAKTVNKIKLPTRLPPSVINNYNTYINGESENLVIDPTDDELPQLPDNYNPVTDDPPDLDGYQDVTPDQEPTDTPDPTPSPTPEPTPSPDYDGSSWIKPIGDFFAGLLSFLKDALIPTQTVDFSPLQNMSTDFGSKFPFSLPGDIGKLFGVLQAEPRRPEFQMIFDLSKVGVPGDPIVWDLNFEQWDDAAAIVKTALYIGFLIGLVFISKNFMKN